MKNKAFFSITILAVGTLAWFGLPWWWVAVAGFVGGVAFKNSVGAIFGLGTAAGTLLWGTAANILNFQNGGDLLQKMGGLTPVLSADKLMWATAALGGLLAGMGALTGCLLRRIFRPDDIAA